MARLIAGFVNEADASAAEAVLRGRGYAKGADGVWRRMAKGDEADDFIDAEEASDLICEQQQFYDTKEK